LAGWLRNCGSTPGREKRFLAPSNSKNSNQLPNPLNILFNGKRGFIPQGVKWIRSEAEHSFSLVAKLKISGAVPPCHHMPSQYTQWQQNTFPWWQHVWNLRDSERAIEYGFQAASCEPAVQDRTNIEQKTECGHFRHEGTSNTVPSQYNGCQYNRTTV
jgi:hypothetical protein